MGLVLFYMLLALSVSFLCSVLEAVLLSTPVSFIAMKEQEGARNAALMMRLKKDPDRPLSAILSFNTIAHTIGSAGVGAEATKVFGDEWFGVISTVLTLLILVLSEIIPKTVGSYYWRQLAMMAAPIIRMMIVIMYPLVWLSEFITKLVSKDQHPLSVSREEVTAMVSVGTEEGVFETQEKAIIQNLFKLDNITVGEIMTPRTVVVAAQENTLLKEFYSDEENRSYSRIPIYGETPDFMTGYILKQTLLENLADDKFDMISGTNGLLGAADGAFMLQKEKRTGNAATLDVSGRDQQDQKLHLVRNPEKLIWELESVETELWKEPPDPILEAVAKMMTDQSWTGTPSQLVEVLEFDIQPNALTKRLNVKASQLENEYGIHYESKRTHAGRRIILNRISKEA